MTSIDNVKHTETGRITFGKIQLPSEHPDLLEIQLKSFKEFFQLETTPENRINEGLYRVFMENFPIEDARGNVVLELVDYILNAPKYAPEECIRRGVTYAVPLKAKLRLRRKNEESEEFETIEQEVFLGNTEFLEANQACSN